MFVSRCTRSFSRRRNGDAIGHTLNAIHPGWAPWRPLFKNSVGVAGVVAAKVTFVLPQNLFAEAFIISATV